MGAFSEVHLRAISEAHLGSSPGVPFSDIWSLLGQGFIWGPYWGARSSGCIMGIPGADMVVYTGAYFGGLYGYIFEAFSRSSFMEFYKQRIL